MTTEPLDTNDAADTHADAVPAFRSLQSARALAEPGLRAMLLWQSVRTAFRLGFAATAALLIGTLIMDTDAPTWMIVAPLCALVASALTGFFAERVQARTETHVSTELRGAAGAVLRDMNASTLKSLPPGELSISMQRHPAAIAGLVTTHRAATVMMAVGPMMAATALFCVSWQAATLLILLTPVMIIFFALVGETIRARANEQEAAFGRLAGQFADRVRTLPTILANHALRAEQDKLTERLSAYATNTFAVLRIAFLNAAIIDFFASLSIAMLAVFLGLGHLKLAMIPGFSDLQLWQSLFILMIAPEYFAPFRRFSEQYHAKAEGLASAEALDRLLATRPPAAPELPAVERAIAALKLPDRGLVVVAGPSGAGKSTLLRRIVGMEGPDGDQAPLVGRAITWVANDCFVSEGKLANAVSLGAHPSETRIRAAAAAVGLLDDTLLPGGLDAGIADGGANLSGGQRLRILIARAIVSDRTIVADEPTAKLDAETATAVRAALRRMAKTRLVLVATHDADLMRHADRLVDLSVYAKEQAA